MKKVLISLISLCCLCACAHSTTVVPKVGGPGANIAEKYGVWSMVVDTGTGFDGGAKGTCTYTFVRDIPIGQACFGGVGWGQSMVDGFGVGAGAAIATAFGNATAAREIAKGAERAAQATASGNVQAAEAIATGNVEAARAFGTNLAPPTYNASTTLTNEGGNQSQAQDQTATGGEGGAANSTGGSVDGVSATSGDANVNLADGAVSAVASPTQNGGVMTGGAVSVTANPNSSSTSHGGNVGDVAGGDVAVAPGAVRVENTNTAGGATTGAVNVAGSTSSSGVGDISTTAEGGSGGTSYTGPTVVSSTNTASGGAGGIGGNATANPTINATGGASMAHTYSSSSSNSTSDATADVDQSDHSVVNRVVNNNTTNNNGPHIVAPGGTVQTSNVGGSGNVVGQVAATDHSVAQGIVAPH
ncbi:MAG: hypothetical protein COZ49_00815 [Candidatus Yonathbacteria bacterium CG_4_10_14_3_um_filter_47_65]|uniref:Uncharacterized protein n=2 Tax=Parcubacteria group TaxID=1794811 RepID=A0A2M8D6I3_9BACT|nr:MAG: hypothetical protein AUJ44_03805 [Candidatus Nomurabacteria bacterium CG1_02_47_685]PIP04051.1 MAG: hypothetical protein COX54_01265 [Candidatus Yonathbacteria bacterium CG23_combo_of_CG06-09_8_20_14_all_46_18]PIQ32236.1 MAG: hypothetical protein COW61_02145 [Candidatus Yonathbacteria bacterium CG17_big_fil_post_rev_8_21_14_2_50_46_19]PIX56699.1 MAG: hypothetical protein COZ49_00815 [Candidatus Yonathbacteria bacterium CG_4_10_14_3_um_filter_47_65]PIY57892.1 MAG: hypothetical protein CO